MASAPTPGVSRRAERDEAHKQVLKMRIGDETRTMAINNLPMKERLICRKATGMPFEAFIGEDRFGLDSLCVLWWMAGRVTDPFLTLTRVEETFPWDADDPDIFDVEIITPDDDEGTSDPES